MSPRHLRMIPGVPNHYKSSAQRELTFTLFVGEMMTKAQLQVLDAFISSLPSI